VVVSDARDFLRARGHDTDKLTDYEIEETFTAAFKNWQHDLVERAFYTGVVWVEKPRKWRKYIDNLHQAIEGTPQPAVVEELLSNFLAQGVPVAN
jgi:hypothetical protein